MATVLLEGLDLEDWYDQKVVPYMGFETTSTSPKPVHVLHGLFNALFEGARSTRLTEDLVARSHGVWKVSQEEVHQRHGAKISLPDGEESFDQLRQALSVILTSDDAFYFKFPSSQMAHVGMTSRDRTHGQIGLLGAALVSNDAVCRADSLMLLNRLRSPQPNPLWGLQRVLIDEPVVQEWVLADPAPLPLWAENPLTLGLWNESTALMRRVLEVTKSCDSLVGLEILALAVTWISQIAYVQVPALRTRDDLRPLLAECTSPGTHESLRDSAVEQLIKAHAGFEDWLGFLLRDSVEHDFETSNINDAQAKHYLRSHKPYKLAGGILPDAAKLEHIYSAYKTAGSGCIDALAWSLRDALLQEMGQKSRDWFHAVGRNCGFVGPRRGRLPRTRIEVSLLPVLVLAGLPDGHVDAISMIEWLTNLEDRFGIVVGPHAGRHLEPRAGEQALIDNQTELARLLVSVGMARRFSDGVTEILDPRTLWKVEA